MIIAAVALPVAAACLYALFCWNRVTAWLGALSAGGLLVAAVLLSRAGEASGLWGLLRVDALSTT